MQYCCACGISGCCHVSTELVVTWLAPFGGQYGVRATAQEVVQQVRFGHANSGLAIARESANDVGLLAAGARGRIVLFALQMLANVILSPNGAILLLGNVILLHVYVILLLVDVILILNDIFLLLTDVLLLLGDVILLRVDVILAPTHKTTARLIGQELRIYGLRITSSATVDGAIRHPPICQLLRWVTIFCGT